MASLTPVEAWTAVVVGEDAAVQAYGVAGAQLSGAERRAAQAGLDAHRRRRTRAAEAVTAAGGQAPSASEDFALPQRLRRPRVARALLADVDLALVGVYADAAAASIDEDRRWAARTAAECSAAAVSWGAPTQAFPATSTSPG